jgi:poly-gamma-glutamate capsule biosynthesis protein CapA/YwtB (metallophosphatase superfamily)
VKGIEIYKEKPILYGCGDFLNDYEGIDGFEAFRGDLGLMYFPSFDPEKGVLTRFQLTPTRTRRFAVERAGAAEAEWLQRALTREGKQLGTRAELAGDGRMELRW